MQSNKTCSLVEQYLGYLSIIKNPSVASIRFSHTKVPDFPQILS